MIRIPIFRSAEELLISKNNNVKVFLSFFRNGKNSVQSYHYNNILSKKTIEAFMIIASFSTLKRARKGI